MVELDFEKILKGIESVGKVTEFLDILKNGDLSDDNRILITAWQENNKRFVWEAAHGENVPIEKILNKGAANEIANSKVACNNEFATMDILKSKLKVAADINICGLSRKCQVYCFTIEDGEDSGAECLVLVSIFANAD